MVEVVVESQTVLEIRQKRRKPNRPKHTKNTLNYEAFYVPTNQNIGIYTTISTTNCSNIQDIIKPGAISDRSKMCGTVSSAHL